MSNYMLTKIKIGFKVLSQVYNWDCIFLHYLGWKKNTCTVKLRNGTKCIIRNKSDAIAFLENFFLETYEQGKEFQIKDNDIILDVGAHIGCFTLYASKKINKGKIFAFEPTSESFNVLKQNVELNQLKNIHIQNAGVLKESGTSVIYVDKNNEIGNSLFLKNKNMVEEKIDIISIEDILKKYDLNSVDLLKLDCEGAEYDIILNLPENILNKFHKIAMEVHSIENFTIHDIEKYLEKNNFNVKIKYLLTETEKNWPMLYAINKKFKKND